MTTIILVAIGISLAAASALFLAFHGGDAFNGGADKAAASTLMNAGLNVESAVQGYVATTGSQPTRLADLSDGSTSERWLAQDIALRQVTSETAVIDETAGRLAYRVGGLSKAVCERVNIGYGTGKTIPETMTGRRGCYGTGTSFTYFVALREGAPGTVRPPRPMIPQSAATDDEKADLIRATGALADWTTSGTLVTPTTAAQLGLVGVDYKGTGTFFAVRTDRDTTRRFYMAKVTSPTVCQKIDAKSGNTRDVLAMTAFSDRFPQEEGCAKEYTNLFYWKRIDARQAPAQVAALVDAVRRMRAAIGTRRVIPTTTTDLGIDVTELSTFTKQINVAPDTLATAGKLHHSSRIRVDGVICRLLDKQAGNNRDSLVAGTLGKSYPTQIEGCAHDYYDQYTYWRWFDPEIGATFAPGYIEELRRIASLVPSEANSEARTLTARALPGMGAGSIVVESGRPNALVFEIRSAVLCQALDNAAGNNRNALSPGTMDTRTYEGCASNYYDRYYYWHRAKDLNGST